MDSFSCAPGWHEVKLPAQSTTEHTPDYRKLGQLTEPKAGILENRPTTVGKEHRLAEIHIIDGETLESALRRFKRKVLQEDIIRETKRHSFYLKPGERKRIKAALARKRNRKKRTRDGASMEQSR